MKKFILPVILAGAVRRELERENRGTIVSRQKAPVKRQFVQKSNLIGVMR